MEKRTLSATIRKEKGKKASKKLRRTGVIPGIIYGQDKEPIMIEVSAHDVIGILHNPMGKNVFIDLEIVDNSKKTKDLVMIKELQRNPVSHKPTHADFYRIDMNKKILCEIPLKEEGLAVGIKAGGRLDHLRKTIFVKCLPNQIPEIIKFDVTNLNINNVFYVKDLILPEGIEPVTHKDVALVKVAVPRLEVVEVAAAPAEGEEVVEEGEEAEVKEGEKGAEKKEPKEKGREAKEKGREAKEKGKEAKEKGKEAKEKGKETKEKGREGKEKGKEAKE